MWKKLEHKFLLPCRRFSKFIIPAVVYLLAYSFKEWLFSTVPSSFDEEPFQSSEEADWRTWKRTQRAGWWCSSSFEQEAPRTSFQGVLRGWLLSESAAYDVNAFPAFTCRFWWYWIPLWMPLLNGICSFLPCSLEIGERERETLTHDLSFPPCIDVIKLEQFEPAAFRSSLLSFAWLTSDCACLLFWDPSTFHPTKARKKEETFFASAHLNQQEVSLKSRSNSFSEKSTQALQVLEFT